MNTRTEDQALAALAPELQMLRPLGEGSTARVYLARESALDRLVAVKVLRPEYAADETARRRFEREARAAARITHPNVIQVHRVGRLASGQPYMVMEYVENRTVADLIAARGPLPADEAANVIAAVAAALAAAHENGVVHRDVRPANIFIADRTGRVLLTDFGIAALLDTASRNVTRLTAVGQRLGEVRYMSPEQLQGEPMTGQSDVYALGIIGYEMLTGRGPFDARPIAGVVSATLGEEAPPILSVRPDVDPRFAALIDHCLAKQPNRRPRASDVPALLHGQGPGADDATPPPTGLAGFFAELQRRRVYQVVVGYAAAAFVILQSAELILPALVAEPEFTFNALVFVTLAGFPVAVFLSWVYDVTGGRLRRTDAVESPTGQRPNRALVWAGFGFSVLVAAFLWWTLTR